jgi:hypothetical protein
LLSSRPVKEPKHAFPPTFALAGMKPARWLVPEFEAALPAALAWQLTRIKVGEPPSVGT